MSNTTNLNLFKHDNPEQNTNPFDVEKALNENWDKVDTYAGNVNEDITEINSAIENINGDITNIETEQTTQNTNIQENADNISSLDTRIGTNESSISNINTTVGNIQTEQTTQNNKISALETDNTINKTNIATLQTDSGHNILLELNTTTYVLTATLKNKAGAILNTSSVDFPVEQLVVSVSYDESTKELVITLKNGQITRVPLGDLISGLQTEITSSNKLSSDLVDDTNNTNKFVTTGEKQSWDAKYNKPNAGIPKTDLSNEVQTSLGKADTALQQHQDISGKEDKSNKVILIDDTNTDIQYPSAKSVYDSQQNQNEKIEKLEVENARLKATLPTTTGTGESITLEKTAEMEFVVPPLPRGNTKQNTTEGHQLLPITDISSFLTEGMKIRITDKILYMQGTSTRGMNITVSVTNVHLIANKAYTIVTFVEGTTNATGTAISTLIGSSKKTNIITIRNQIGTNILNYTPTEDTDLTKINAYVSSENLTCDIKVKLMIVEGTYTSSTIPAWEEYTNGASPNPSYPQEVQVVKGSNVININNENLFNLTLQNNGINITTGNCYVDIEGNELLLTATNTDMFFGAVQTQNNGYQNDRGVKIYRNNNSKISFKLSNTELNKNYFTAYDVNGISLGYTSINSYQGTYTFPSNCEFVTFRVGKGNATIGTSYPTTIMMVYGDEIPTSFLVHQEQTLPIDLPVENLFDGELELGTIISGTGETGVSNNAIRSVDYIAVNPNTTYILSNNKNYTPYVFEYNSSKTYVRNSTTQVTPYTFTTTSTTKYIKFRTIESKVENDLTTKFMLELGSKANAYTPYGTTPIELCKIGDYQDYFYKDNGKWYLHKEIYKYIFTGQEDFVRVANTGNPFPYFRLYLSQPLGKASTATTILSNRYKGGTDTQLVQNDFKTISMSGNVSNQLNITDDYATANDFKAFLENNLTYVYYILVQPTNTEITDTTLINQLEAIYNAISYEGQTNISGISGGENPIFDVEAYQNTKLILENLDDRLSLIEG